MYIYFYFEFYFAKAKIKYLRNLQINFILEYFLDLLVAKKTLFRLLC